MEHEAEACGFGRCAFGRQCVEGSGPWDARILLLGEAPGKRELEQGRPFVGPAGRVLDELLVEANLDRALLRITNTCGCVDMGREDKRPLPAELEACRPRLLAEVEVVQPRVILLMGNTALGAYLPGFRIGEVVGMWRSEGGRVIIPTYHPAHLLRGAKQVRPVILRALQDARRVAEAVETT